MALEVTAAIIGILAAAGKVVETLGPYVSAWKHAPKNAAAIVSEINASRVCLSALQGLLDDLDSRPDNRKSLIQIDQLIATFTDGVLLFSELETIILDISENRSQWAWKDKELGALVSRLQCFKNSISVMLNILQCGSDREALNNGKELLSLTTSLLQNNLELSQRMARLENHLVRDDSIRTSRPATVLHVQNGSRTEANHIEWSAHMSPPWLFEIDLLSSRVYQRVKRSTCDASYRSSVIDSHAWSALSDISISDISCISVVALPVEWAELSNGRHYKFNRLPEPSAIAHPTMNAYRDRSFSLMPRSRIYSRPFAKSMRIFVIGAETTPIMNSANLWAGRHLQGQFGYWQFEKKCASMGSNVLLTINCLTGSVPSRFLLSENLNAQDCFVLAYSAMFKASFDHLPDSLPEFFQSRQDLHPFSLAVVADHWPAMSRSVEKSLYKGARLANSLGCRFYEASDSIPDTMELVLYDLVQARCSAEKGNHDEEEALRSPSWLRSTMATETIREPDERRSKSPSPAFIDRRSLRNLTLPLASDER